MPHIYNYRKLKGRRQNLRNNMPKPEQILWYYLKAKNLNGYKFRRQYSVGSYILDFYCPILRLTIEVDGDSHFVSVKAAADDKKRDKFLLDRDIKVIRFTNLEIMKNIEQVIEKIKTFLPPLTPPAPGGGIRRLNSKDHLP